VSDFNRTSYDVLPERTKTGTGYFLKSSLSPLLSPQREAAEEADGASSSDEDVARADGEMGQSLRGQLLDAPGLNACLIALE